MPTPRISLAQWRTAVDGAAKEIANYALQLPTAVVGDPVGLERADAMIGAHIPLVGEGMAYDMAVVSSLQGCQAMSRAILCLEPDAPLRDTQMADAVGEIVNMMGGTVKRRIAGLGAELTLGLPLFIHGYIQPTERLMVIALPTRFGAIDTIVMIAGQRD